MLEERTSIRLKLLSHVHVAYIWHDCLAFEARALHLLVTHVLELLADSSNVADLVEPFLRLCCRLLFLFLRRGRLLVDESVNFV